MQEGEEEVVVRGLDVLMERTNGRFKKVHEFPNGWRPGPKGTGLGTDVQDIEARYWRDKDGLIKAEFKGVKKRTGV